MNTHRKLAVAFLAISAAAPLHAANEHEGPDRQTDRKPTDRHPDEDFAAMGKLMGEVKEQILDAHRQRDIAMRGLEEQKRMTDELRRRNEELVKLLEADRRPGDAAPGGDQNRRMQDQRPPQHQQPQPPVAELRGEISGAMRDLSALRAEIGKIKEGMHAPGDIAEMRKKFELLGQEKAKAVEISKQLASKLEAEMQARRKLEQKIATGSDSDSKLAETTQKLEKANEALTVQLRAIAVAKTEAQRADQQRETAEKSLAEREAEVKRMKEAMEKRRRQPKGENNEN